MELEVFDDVKRKRPGRKKKDPNDPTRAESRQVTLRAEEWATLDILSKGNAVRYVAELARENIRRMGGKLEFDIFTRAEVSKIVRESGYHIHYFWQIADYVYDKETNTVFSAGEVTTFEELMCKDGWKEVQLFFLNCYTLKAKKAFRNAFENHANSMNFNPNTPPCGGKREPCGGKNQNIWEMPWNMKGVQYIDRYTDTPEESGKKWAEYLLAEFQRGKGFICRMCEIAEPKK